jgi:hypothetical protein
VSKGAAVSINTFQQPFGQIHHHLFIRAVYLYKELVYHRDEDFNLAVLDLEKRLGRTVVDRLMMPKTPIRLSSISKPMTS